jgi:hypothetical protein
MYSLGNQITQADVVLAPAVEGALRFEVELEKFPTVARIYQRLRVLDALLRRGTGDTRKILLRSLEVWSKCLEGNIHIPIRKFPYSGIVCPAE